MKRLRILIALLSVLALLLTSCGTPPDNGGNDEVGGDEVGGNTNTEEGDNDFAVSVCGDDLVIYAAAERLYPYLFEVMKDKIFANAKDGALTVVPEDSIIYHTS